MHTGIVDYLNEEDAVGFTPRRIPGATRLTACHRL
jgi:hypothetical protein